jgi:hypothetical protein
MPLRPIKEAREPDYPNRRSHRILRAAATVGASAALLLTAGCVRTAGTPVTAFDERPVSAEGNGDDRHDNHGDPAAEARMPGEPPVTHHDGESDEQDGAEGDEDGESAPDEARMPGRPRTAVPAES